MSDTDGDPRYHGWAAGKEANPFGGYDNLRKRVDMYGNREFLAGTDLKNLDFQENSAPYKPDSQPSFIPSGSYGSHVSLGEIVGAFIGMVREILIGVVVLTLYWVFILAIWFASGANIGWITNLTSWIIGLAAIFSCGIVAVWRKGENASVKDKSVAFVKGAVLGGMGGSAVLSAVLFIITMLCIIPLLFTG